MKLILASGSPRRQQMLRDLGLQFSVRAPDIDEARLHGEPVLSYVQRLAREKAERVATTMTSHPSEALREWAILAADTIVVLGKSVLGKPDNADDAYRMLRKLSGHSHDVVTAYCWLGRTHGKTQCVVRSVRTKVQFATRPNEFWKWYVGTKEPLDKAGAYAAQGIGVSFIEKVTGSYSNVVGLPLSHVLDTFQKTFRVDLRDYCSKTR